MSDSIFFRIKNNIKSFLRSLAFTKEKLASFKVAIISHFLEFKYRLAHLVESNIELAIFHLNNGNYFDAFLRLKLITKYLDSDNQSAHYLLGWYYFLQEEYDQAQHELLLSPDKDRASLLNFIKNIDMHDQIPYEIYQIIREMNMYEFESIFTQDPQQIAQNFIKNMVFSLKASEEGQHNILELGANIGVLYDELSSQMPAKFTIDAVEKSSEMLGIIKEKAYDYKMLRNVMPNEYLASCDKVYDLVISLEGLDYYKSIREILVQILPHLSQTGYIIFGCFCAEKAKFSSKVGRYIYNRENILRDIENLHLTIIHSLKFDISKEYDYRFYICRKTDAAHALSAKYITDPNKEDE